MPDEDPQAFEDAAATVSRWIGSTGKTHDFETVAASVAEDIVVLVPVDGHFIVAGGMVAMPSGWSIRQKLGLSVAQTHGTVPGFAEHLQAKTDRMLHALKPGRFVERHNLIFNPSDEWTLLPDRWDELDQVRQSMTPADVAAKVHLRTEYQSFARCDQGTTCLFCIRTYQSPIADLDAERRNELKNVLQSWSPEILDYKRITPMLDSLIQFLSYSSNGK